MTVEELKNWQNRELEEFRRRASSDRDAARSEAVRRLQDAGIVDKRGALAEIYR